LRKTRILIAAAAVLATVTGGLTLTSRNDIADAAVVWHDDFDGAAGTGVDTSKWNFDTGGSGWGNQELEYYTSGTNNVAKDGQGHLVITARRQTGNSCWYGTCTWTSGRIQTAGKFTQQYGHIEARIQVPDGQGLWPAFWMLGGSNWPNDGEIDIMEVVGRQPNTLYGTLHGPGYSGGNGYGATRNSSTPYWQAFHTYAIDWSPNLIIWRVDGSEFFRATPESLRAAKGNVSWVYNHGFFIIMNLAVGGNFGGTVGNLPTENRMVIDYVHVDTSNSGPTTPPRRPRRRAAACCGPLRPTAASTSPARTRWMRCGCRSTTATAPARSSGRCGPTALPPRSANAWTRPLPARRTARRSSSTRATARGRRSSLSTRAASWSTPTPASASTWSTTAPPTVPCCNCGPVPAEQTRDGREADLTGGPVAKKPPALPQRWLPEDPPGQPARHVGRDLVVADPDHRIDVKYPQAVWDDDARRWVSDAANPEAIGEAGLSFILGVRIPDVMFASPALGSPNTYRSGRNDAQQVTA